MGKPQRRKEDVEGRFREQLQKAVLLLDAFVTGDADEEDRRQAEALIQEIVEAGKRSDLGQGRIEDEDGDD